MAATVKLEASRLAPIVPGLPRDQLKASKDELANPDELKKDWYVA